MVILLLLGSALYVCCQLSIASGPLLGIVTWMIGFGPGFLFLFLVLVVVVGLLMLGIPLLWTLRRSYLVLVSLMFTFLLLMWLSLLILLIAAFWILFLGMVGSSCLVS